MIEWISGPKNEMAAVSQTYLGGDSLNESQVDLCSGFEENLHWILMEFTERLNFVIIDVYEFHWVYVKSRYTGNFFV